MRFFAQLLILSFLLAAGSPAHAAMREEGEAYARPILKELNQTFLMLGGLDAHNPNVDDNYMKMLSCSIYLDKFKDDFAWNKVREDIMDRVDTKKEYYRVMYEIYGVVYLGRYNFDTQDFPFVEKSALVNVGSMSLLAHGADMLPLCGSETVSFFPDDFVFNLSQPLTFDRLKLPVTDANKLLDKLEAMHNDDRKIYVRFRVRVTSAVPANAQSRSKPVIYTGGLRGDITSIDLFLDHEMTEPLIRVSLDDEVLGTAGGKGGKKSH